MATYKIKWLKVQNPDWKVLTLEDNGVEIAEVSVNRVNKKGEAFPGFDEIINVGTVEGELWRSDAGKNYLFAPKPQKGNSNFKNHQIEKTMATKREDIANSQERKEHGIRVASTFNQACALAIAEYHEQRRLSSTGPTLEQLIKKWREWCWLNWEMDESNQVPPFQN